MAKNSYQSVAVKFFQNPPRRAADSLPLFIWAIYATSIILILATPVLTITLALIAIERFLHIGIS